MKENFHIVLTNYYLFFVMIKVTGPLQYGCAKAGSYYRQTLWLTDHKNAGKKPVVNDDNAELTGDHMVLLSIGWPLSSSDKLARG